MLEMNAEQLFLGLGLDIDFTVPIAEVLPVWAY